VSVAPSDKASTSKADKQLLETLATVAPGTALRDGLERILRGRTGGLFVLGSNKDVEALCSGGFSLGIEFTATRLRELAKMDGAIILDAEATSIHRAAVHLMPDPSINSDETGTRHRTAERVAKQTGFPVLSVSQSMNIIALYVAGRRYVLEDSAAILSRANQALSDLEIEDLVSVRDVAIVAQRLEMVRRIAGEIDGYVIELGSDGRLLSLQLVELIGGVDNDRELIVRDYLPSGRRSRTVERALSDLDALSDVELLDLSLVAKALGYPGASEDLDVTLSPRGYRLLARVPRLPNTVVDRLVGHFGGLQRLLAASIDDLQAVEGVGEARARTVREGLSRLAETSILERYV
jgi:diadenylate cyclase